MKIQESVSALSALELEVVALFVRVADLLNLPRSWESCMVFSLLLKNRCVWMI